MIGRSLSARTASPRRWTIGPCSTVLERGISVFTASPRVHLLDPFDLTEPLVEQSEDSRGDLLVTQAQYGWAPSWPVWPQPGGWLPWGERRDGIGSYGWLTQGFPDSWRAAYLSRADEGRAFDIGMAEALLRLMLCCLTPELDLDDTFRDTEGGGHLEFVPYRRPQQLLKKERLETIQLKFRGAILPPNDVLFEPGLSMDERKDRLGSLHTKIDAENTEQCRRFESFQEQLLACGYSGGGQPGIHRKSYEEGPYYEYSIGYPPHDEDGARQLVKRLIEHVQLPLVEIRNVEYQQVWPDLYT